jgi:hypothetical protein
MALRAGTRCEPALLQSEIDEVVAWLFSQGRTGFFSYGPAGAASSAGVGGRAAANASSVSIASGISHLRTRISIPSGFQLAPSGGMSEHGLRFMSLLNKAIDETLMVHTDFAHCNPDLIAQQVARIITNDVTLLALAIGLICLYMLLYFRHVALGLLAVAQISISFPCAAPPLSHSARLSTARRELSFAH